MTTKTSFDPVAVYARLLERSIYIPNTCCFIWCGAGSPHYGRIQWEGKLGQVHRISYYLEHGNWPEVVLHTCDNPPCWNPDHLVGGTHYDNVHDMMTKNRAIKNKVGSGNSYARLTEEQVCMIKGLLFAKTLTQEQIAQQFNVCRRTISFIKTGHTWKHV